MDCRSRVDGESRFKEPKYDFDAKLIAYWILKRIY